MPLWPTNIQWGGRPARHVGMWLSIPLLLGCATSTPHTTRLADADLTQVVLDMRAQLGESDFLAHRTADSPEARLVLRRVENLSTDRITIAEQWSLAARVLSEPEMQHLLRSKNVILQLPPEKIRLLETYGQSTSNPQSGTLFPSLQPENQPTHLLRSQIASATRAGAVETSRSLHTPQTNIRKEYYLLTYVIEDLQSRELLWQGTAELAREAEGTVVD